MDEARRGMGVCVTFSPRFHSLKRMPRFGTCHGRACDVCAMFGSYLGIYDTGFGVGVG